MRFLSGFLFAVALAGCPSKATKGGSSELGPCTKMGESCQFAEGKLGTCVVREPCPSGSCFVCQSQH